jgi:hypothetical protein
MITKTRYGDKLAARGKPCCFVQYSKEKTGLRAFDPAKNIVGVYRDFKVREETNFKKTNGRIELLDYRTELEVENEERQVGEAMMTECMSFRDVQNVINSNEIQSWIPAIEKEMECLNKHCAW